MRDLFLILFSAFLLAGCATNMREQFDRVQVGMEKNDVLNLMDSPQRTQRWHGMDRWTYIFYDQDVRYEKEVHFADGKANYVGEVYKPEVSAEEQDARNEAANKEAETYAQARREEIKRGYSDYEQRMRGQDTIRYVPQFIPVR